MIKYAFILLKIYNAILSNVYITPCIIDTNRVSYHGSVFCGNVCNGYTCGCGDDDGSACHLHKNGLPHGRNAKISTHSVEHSLKMNE